MDDMMLYGYGYRSINIHEHKTREQQALNKSVVRGALDESLLLLASEATVAVEALAFAVAVVEATVGAVGELGEIAEVVVVVDLDDSHAASATGRDRERTSASSVNVHLKEVLDTGLARLISKLDGEVASGGT